MPIKDLTNKRRLPRGGHIRLGEMAVSQKSGKEYPRAIDHFKADFENKDHEALFYQLYGDRPQRIRVCFGDNDPEKVFSQWYKCYGQSGLKCKGDGETAGRWIDAELVEVPCLGPEDCEFAQSNAGRDGKPGCKRLAALQVFVHGIPDLAVFQINTTSRNSIINVNTGLDLLDKLTGGNIAGKWIWLKLSPHEVQAEGKKKTVHVLEIEIPVGLHNIGALESAFSAPLALPAPSDAKDPYLMPANGFESDEPAAPPARKAAPSSARHAEPVTHKAEPADLADDPDVIRAFEQSGLAPVVQQGLLASAKENRWPVTKLLEMIFSKSPNGGAKDKPTSKPAAARQAATPPASSRPASPPAAGPQPADNPRYARSTSTAAPSNGNARAATAAIPSDDDPLDDF